jgi:hypothetical protein
MTNNTATRPFRDLEEIVSFLSLEKLVEVSFPLSKKGLQPYKIGVAPSHLRVGKSYDGGGGGRIVRDLH